MSTTLGDDTEKHPRHPAEDDDEDQGKPLLINQKEEIRTLTRWQIFLFTSLQAGVSFMFGVSGGWLAFHYLPSEDSGDPRLINPAVYSATVLIGRLVNGFLEPWIGYFSDRCSSSLGRRKPFILLASPLMSLTFALMWFMPFEPLTVEASFWFFALYVVNNFFGACVLAPYIALLPELSNDKNDRVTISAAQGVWGMLGNIVVALVGPVDNLLGEGVEIGGYMVSGIQLISVIMAVVTTVLCWVSVLVVKERPLERHHISEFSILHEIKVAYGNAAFRYYIAFHALTVMAVTMWQSTFPFLCTVVLEAEGGLVQPGKGETWVGIFALITVVGALFGTPLVSFLAKRIGKRKILVPTGFVITVSLLFNFFVQYLPDPGVGMLVLMILATLPMTALFILPNAVFADVVENDEKETGKRREGIYTGVRLLSIRVMAGIGTFLIIPIISIGDTSEDPLGIMLVSLVACVFCLIGTLGLVKYPYN